MTENRTIRRRVLVGALGAGAAAPGLACGQRRAGDDELQGANRIEFAFADQIFTATLNDSPPARELLSMLPLDLAIRDFSSNEKIAFLPRKLLTRGAQAYTDPMAGDLCYYAPWGNLALFYEGYSASPDVIRLGRLDGGVAPLRKKGEFALRIRRAA